MKIGEFLTTKRGELQKLEAAANGQQHDLGPGNLLQILEGLLGAIDKDIQLIGDYADSQESTQVAMFLARRAEQLSEVRGHVVSALNAAGNKEIDI